MGQIRLLAAVLALVAAGAMVLGWSSRSRRASAAVLAPNRVAAGLRMAPASSNDIKPEARDRARSLLAGVPMIFEPNQGQNGLDRNDPRARFIAHGAGYGLFLGSTGATLSLRPAKNSASSSSALLQMKLAGANPAASLTGASILPGKSNYLIGNDPAKWRSGISQFARVRYENIYPGINLVFYGTQGQLEYDFQVAPGADPSQAELEFDGAKHLELQDGALVIRAEGGSVRLEAPRVFQEVAGMREPVEASFVLRGSNRAGFEIAPYNHSRELTIDPVLSFSTYFGGTGDERNTFVAVDGSGNIYLTGSTTSPSLPVGTGITTVFQSSPGASGAQNIYIAKINPVNNPPQLVYVTYLGGTGPDVPVGIAVDGAGDTYVAGTTSSANFPHSSTPYQSTPLTAGQHVFVSELLSDAVTLKYSSYLSGNGDADIASGMAIDSGGHIYVTGTTNSNNAGDGAAGIQFPASTLPRGLPFQALPSTAPVQFFVTKVDTQAPTTGSIDYSTYFGGGNFTTAQPVATGGGITVDTNGNIYFAGTTNFLYTGCAGCSSTDFPIKDAYQPCLNQVPPTVITNPAQCTNTSTTASDAFVAKLNPGAPAGSGQLQWSTYLGGSQNDFGTGVAIDTGAANVYITGTTNSPDVTAVVSFAGFEPCLNSPNQGVGCTSTGTANDAFVARFSNPVTTTGTTSNVALTYFSYLGGTADESGTAITVDNASGAIVTGSTDSVDFPVFPLTGNDIQGTYGGSGDAFVARLNTTAVSGQNTVGSWATYFGGSGADEGTSIALDVNQNAYVAGDTTSTDLHLTGLFTSLAGGYDAFVGEVTPNASLALTGVLGGGSQAYIAAGSQATFTYTLTNEGPEPANNILITDNISSAVTGVSMTYNGNATATSGTCSGGSTSTLISCSIPELQFGSTATIVIALVPTADPQGGSRQFNGGPVTATATNSLGPVTTTVSGSMSDFAIAVSPANISIPAAGDSATYQITLTPNPVYSPNISLACSGAPANSACTFSPTSVTLVGSSPGTATLTISTVARPITTGAAGFLNKHFYAVWLAIPAMAFFGLAAGGSSRRKRRICGIMLLCLVSALLVFLPACSHSSTQPPVSGTPPGQYSMSITGTSGNDSKSVGIQLNVP